ncbi:MAG: ABC transporter permease [Nitrososphaerales archaeon]
MASRALQRFWSRRFKDLRVIWSSTSGKVGLVITLTLLFVAIFAPLIAPFNPSITSGPSYAPPTWKHILGTDDVGEDILSQLIWGTRGSLLVGLAAGAIATIVGVGIGLFAGYYTGKLGEGLMRFTDVILVLPLLPLLIVIASIFPASVWLVIGTIGLLSWPSMARVIRSQTLTLKARPFVDASRLSGMNDLEIMLRVLLPNMIPLVVLYSVFAIVTAVVIEAGLDFIGLGSINNLSWGIMLYFALGRNALLRGEWWWFITPGAMIAIMGIGFIMLGHGAEKLARIRA